MIDAKRPFADFDIRRSAGSNAHMLLPGEPLGCQPVRARYISEGPGILRDISQEQPSLDRRVKGVGVEKCLRIRRAGAGVAQDGLHPDHRLGIAAAGVANEPSPIARLQYCAKRWERGDGTS